ncbi:MAG: trimethylamine methyltransferase family protein [Actinobacteria bacterium]|nr:trimethylamine methyltransferase family protein [Actinomycetota bacterium]
MADTSAHVSRRPGRGRWSLLGLEPDEIETLHQATLHVLWNVGVRVEDPEAADVFRKGGATVEAQGDQFLVRMPAALVEESIAAAPESFTLCGRRPEDDFLLEPGVTGYTAGYGEHVRIVDPYTYELRSTTKQDLADISRLQDALDIISFVERAACSGDKPTAVQSVHNYDAMVRGTSKHVFLGFNGGDNAGAIIDMAEAVAGGADELRARPIVTCLLCPTSPLGLVSECTSALIEAASRGVGMAMHPMSLSGASSPATPVGVVVQHNAEVLSAIVLAQIVRPGTPCMMANNSTIMDLLRSASPVGVPEMALHSVASVQLAQRYGIPSWAGAGATDSKLPDAQQGYDFTLTAMPAALAGANIVYGIGAIESLITFDYASMIMGAEQAGRIRRVTQGIDMSELDAALKVIEEVGPGGEYVSHDHTFEHMREMSSSSLFDRKAREIWERDGSRTAAERAYDIARALLESHRPIPLDAAVEARLDEIVAARELEAQTGR